MELMYHSGCLVVVYCLRLLHWKLWWSLWLDPRWLPFRLGTARSRPFISASGTSFLHPNSKSFFLFSRHLFFWDMARSIYTVIEAVAPDVPTGTHESVVHSHDGSFEWHTPQKVLQASFFFNLKVSNWWLFDTLLSVSLLFFSFLLFFFGDHVR